MDFSDFFKTKLQANDFSTRVATIAGNIFKTDFDLEKAIMEQFGLQKKDLFMTYLRDNKINVASASELKTFLEKMQQDIAALPTLSLTIAFEPTDETLKGLSEWFLLNIKKQVLFTITVDPKIIAGASITFNGKYVDSSIKPICERVIADMVNKSTPAALVEKEKPQHQSIEHLHLGR